MIDSDDPPRMVDDPSTAAELRELLTAARTDGLDVAAATRVRARVHELAPTRGAWRWCVIGGGTAVVLGWLALRPAAIEDDGVRDPARRAVETDPIAVVAVVEPDHAVLEATEPIAKPALELVAATPAAPSVAATDVAPVRVTTASARRPAAKPVAVADPPAASSSEEARLLLAARRALARDPADALARAEEHARRFADGALAPEREIVAVRALVALGRRDDAETRGERFVQRFPDSVHLAALARALE